MTLHSLYRLSLVALLCLSCVQGAAASSAPGYTPYQQRVEERRQTMDQQFTIALLQEPRPLNMADVQQLDERTTCLASSLTRWQRRLELTATCSPEERQEKSQLAGRLLFISHDLHLFHRKEAEFTTRGRGAQLHLLEERLGQLSWQIELFMASHRRCERRSHHANFARNF